MSQSEPVLDSADIQGNLLPGFGRAMQYLVGFSATAPESLRAALREIVPLLTNLDAALDHRDARKAFAVGLSSTPPQAPLWLNYALGLRATDALGLQEARATDTAFVQGMVPSRTGDSPTLKLPDGSPNLGCPANWKVGGPARPLDILLVFAAESEIESQAAPVIDALASAGLVKIYSEIATLLPGHEEHFGFRDGISNPGVFGVIESGGTTRYLTTRYGVPSRDGVEYGAPGQPLQDPDQFMFTDGRLKNGSFMVFRRLTQDVRSFLADTKAIATDLSLQLRRSISEDEVRARIVGRWRSGEPLVRSQIEPPQAESEQALNYFDFARPLPDLQLATGEGVAGIGGDPYANQGGQCPVWAHIRKVNPRDGGTNKGGPDETRSFQMLRRGIPFGPAYDRNNPAAPINDAERGLLFISYQRTIKTQFEELNKDWMNSQDNPVAGGYDLLVGQLLNQAGEHTGKPAQFFDSVSAASATIRSSSNWVLPTGGAYLFAPSIGWTKQTAQGAH